VRTLRGWLVRWGGLFGKRRQDRELADELESHVQMHIEENLGRGMTPEEARRQALIKLGGIEQTKENYRDRRGFPLLESLVQDVRFGLRMLRKNPGFTAVAVLTLALGIGANTAVFTVLNKVLLDPLPYPQPDRLVQLERSFPEDTGAFLISIPKFMVWRNQTRVFENFAASDHDSIENLTEGDHPEEVTVAHVSADYFSIFGARLAAGRAFTSEEDRPRGPRVALVSNGYWRSHFGEDANLVGRTVSLDGEPYEVIGIVGPSFAADPRADIWLPLQADPNSTSQAHHLLVVARLKPDVTLAQAQAAMKVAAEEFRRKFPMGLLGPGESATAVPLRDVVIGNVRPALFVLLGAVGFVLLIACANMANLLLARATLRGREIAIRAALGAGRRRIIFQLLTESILMSMAGGAVGLALGYFGVRGLLEMNPGNIPRIGEHGSAVTFDWRVLVFTVFVSVLTAILFGLLPAWHVSRTDLTSALNEGSARSGASLRQNKSRSALVVTEMALAVILMTGAGLLIRTFAALRSVDTGFELHNVLTMQTRLNGPRFEEASGIAQLARDGEHAIRDVPGVEAAALTDVLPLTGNLEDMVFVIDAHPPADHTFSGDAQWRIVSPAYFDTFRIPLLRGRLLTDRDDGTAAPVALISETMAKEFWPGSNPVGESITIGGKSMGPALLDSPHRQIIGVVADVKDTGLNDSVEPTMYEPVAQMSDALATALEHGAPMTWVVRTKNAPYSMSADIERELRAASGGLPVANIRSMDQVVSESTARDAFNMSLLSIFAAIAMLLAAIGIYGVLAYLVQQRTHEIGIRMALGARSGDVLSMVLRDGLWLCLAGIFIGIGGAFPITRLMKSLIYEVSPTDPVTFASVAVLLAVVALVACFIPAWRATRVDPMVALRYE
jgi:putative ABC transport system permease protein